MQSVLVQLCSHVTRHARVSSPSRLRWRMAQTERSRDSETGDQKKGIVEVSKVFPSLVASS